MTLSEHRVKIRPDKKPDKEHARRFNAPSADEVAVVMVGEESGSRDIILQKRDNQVKRVADTHRPYDPLQSPLLFVNREDGYSIENMQMKLDEVAKIQMLYETNQSKTCGEAKRKSISKTSWSSRDQDNKENTLVYQLNNKRGRTQRHSHCIMLMTCRVL